MSTKASNWAKKQFMLILNQCVQDQHLYKYTAEDSTSFGKRHFWPKLIKFVPATRWTRGSSACGGYRACGVYCGHDEGHQLQGTATCTSSLHSRVFLCPKGAAKDLKVSFAIDAALPSERRLTIYLQPICLYGLCQLGTDAVCIKSALASLLELLSRWALLPTVARLGPWTLLSILTRLAVLACLTRLSILALSSILALPSRWA